MKTLLIMLGLIYLFTGCAKHYDAGNLPGGYEVVAMNPVEVYIRRPNGSLIAGPKLKSLAISGEIIFTITEVNIYGKSLLKYGIIDTTYGIEVLDNSKDEFLHYLDKYDISYPEFENPANFFSRTME